MLDDKTTLIKFEKKYRGFSPAFSFESGLYYEETGFSGNLMYLVDNFTFVNLNGGVRV